MPKKQRYATGQQAINLKRRLYWSEELGPGVITNLQDAFGDDTEDEEDAAFAIVRIHEACWLNVPLDAFAASAPN